MFHSTKERLYTGIFECSACAARYDITDAYQTELICDACGAELVPEVESDDDEGSQTVASNPATNQ